ncbi:thioredoxin family protein [Streptomyces sp. Ru73]|nr:thioredoxin family protein [Streptomyces sp. Ru73]
MDVDDHQDIAEEVGIEAMPTFTLVKEGARSARWSEPTLRA